MTAPNPHAPAMSTSDGRAPRPGAESPSGALWASVACLVALGLFAYAGSTRGPFVYLDQAAIRDNPTIRRLWPLNQVLVPPVGRGVTVEGRPLVNLSFAANYALSGGSVTGYHVTNIAIHLLAGLTLFGIVRRTLRRLGDANALLVAWLAAALWTVHPVQTESVTYMVQRAESLMGLFYLLALYGLIRARDETARSPRAWMAVSWTACLLGMASKEVMASAPVILFAYDAIFLAGSARAAWAARWRYYAALALTWLPLAWFVLSTGGNRGGTSGFALGVSLWQYLLTQCVAILHYLRLALWPSPLVFYYEVHWYKAAEVIPEGLGMVALLVLGAVLLWRKPRWGFLVLWFLAILAPTSLVPGISQTIAEHRMYLALAPVMVALVLGVRACVRRLGFPPPAAAAVLVPVALLFCAMTIARNGTYATEVGIWSDTVAKAPGNPYSRNNLGVALSTAGRKAEAVDAFRGALEIDPDYTGARDNLGLALDESGKPGEAVEEYLKAVAVDPNLEEARINLGVALMHLGQPHGAILHFEKATELAPSDPNAFNDLAGSELAVGRIPAAIAHFQRAVALDPGNGQGWANLGDILAQAGQWQGALAAYQKAVVLMPPSADVQSNLGAAYASVGQLPAAVDAYRRALALTPNDPDIHENLAQALAQLGRAAEARSEHLAAERLRSAH
jgi:tetratricopeptide (TPR) repeat protein